MSSLGHLGTSQVGRETIPISLSINFHQEMVVKLTLLEDIFKRLHDIQAYIESDQQSNSMSHIDNLREEVKNIQNDSELLRLKIGSDVNFFTNTKLEELKKRLIHLENLVAIDKKWSDLHNDFFNLPEELFPPFPFSIDSPKEASINKVCKRSYENSSNLTVNGYLLPPVTGIEKTSNLNDRVHVTNLCSKDINHFTYIRPYSIFHILQNAINMGEKDPVCPSCKKNLKPERQYRYGHFSSEKNKSCYISIIHDFGISYKMANDSYPSEWMKKIALDKRDKYMCIECKKLGEKITIFMHIIEGGCEAIKKKHQSMIAWIDIEETEEKPGSIKHKNMLAEVDIERTGEKYKGKIDNPIEPILTLGTSKKNNKECINCKKIFANRYNLRSHILLIPECRKRALNLYGIFQVSHMKYFSPDTHLMGESKRPQCKGCGKIFCRKEAIKHVVSDPCSELKKTYLATFEHISQAHMGFQGDNRTCTSPPRLATRGDYAN